MDDFIPTRVSKLKEAPTNFVSVSYEKPKKKQKTNVVIDPKKVKNDKESSGPQTAADVKKQQEREMKRVRYEVMKFGMTGFEKKEASKARVNLLISLGAKPPKNRRQNYKRLQEDRLKKKEAEKKDVRESGLGSSMMNRHKKLTQTRKKVSDGILDVYGKVDKGIKKRPRR